MKIFTNMQFQFRFFLSIKSLDLLTRLSGRRRNDLRSIHAIEEPLYDSALLPMDNEYEIYSRGEDWRDWEFHPQVSVPYLYHQDREKELPRAAP